MNMRNRLANVHNMYQEDFKRVLCVCSAGLLRSPTAAIVLAAEPFNFNTRAVGVTSEYALIPIDQALLTWSQEIVCMEQDHADRVAEMLKTFNLSRMLLTLNIPDSFSYRQKELQVAIKENYLNCNNGGE